MFSNPRVDLQEDGFIYSYGMVCFMCVDWDSAVSIVTRYGLDGPGIESGWGAKFSAPV